MKLDLDNIARMTVVPTLKLHRQTRPKSRAEATNRNIKPLKYSIVDP
jgi:hypothetical protein